MKLAFDGLSLAQVCVRVLWIALRLIVALELISRGNYFFYQGF